MDNPINNKPPVGYGYIYKITNPIGKSYIGQTKHSILNRLDRHMYSKNSKALIETVQKYGKRNLVVECLGTYPIENLQQEEIKAIKEHHTIFPNGLNLCDGTKGWKSITKIHKLWKNTLSDAQLKRLYQPKHNINQKELHKIRSKKSKKIWKNLEYKAKRKETLRIKRVEKMMSGQCGQYYFDRYNIDGTLKPRKKIKKLKPIKTLKTIEKLKPVKNYMMITPDPVDISQVKITSPFQKLPPLLPIMFSTAGNCPFFGNNQ